MQFKESTSVTCTGTSYSEIYAQLVDYLDAYLKAKKDQIPILDERHLNQAISNFYEIDNHLILQGKKLNLYIDPSVHNKIQKCYFAGVHELPRIFESCDKKDLVYVLIYWTMILTKICGTNFGITPGFEGFNWLKMVFPEKFNFFKTKVTEVKNDNPQSRINQTNKTSNNDFPGLDGFSKDRQTSKPVEINDSEFPSFDIPHNQTGTALLMQKKKNPAVTAGKTKPNKKKQNAPVQKVLEQGGLRTNTTSFTGVLDAKKTIPKKTEKISKEQNEELFPQFSSTEIYKPPQVETKPRYQDYHSKYKTAAEIFEEYGEVSDSMSYDSNYHLPDISSSDFQGLPFSSKNKLNESDFPEIEISDSFDLSADLVRDQQMKMSKQTQNLMIINKKKQKKKPKVSNQSQKTFQSQSKDSKDKDIDFPGLERTLISKENDLVEQLKSKKTVHKSVYRDLKNKFAYDVSSSEEEEKKVEKINNTSKAMVDLSNLSDITPSKILSTKDDKQEISDDLFPELGGEDDAPLNGENLLESLLNAKSKKPKSKYNAYKAGPTAWDDAPQLPSTKQKPKKMDKKEIKKKKEEEELFPDLGTDSVFKMTLDAKPEPPSIGGVVPIIGKKKKKGKR